MTNHSLRCQFRLNNQFLVRLALPILICAPNLLAEDIAWPQWRGGSQNGVASGDRFPINWSDSEGIAWKQEIPGLGGSTPVIDGKHAYITTGFEDKNHVIAVNIASGKIAWQFAVGKDIGNKHRKGSGSNPSAVVDGDAVYAYFRSGDLVKIDRAGKKGWALNLQSMYGEDTLWWDLGSSPLLTKDAVVIAVMQTGPSYLVAFDRKSGKELWKTDRNVGAPKEAAQSYATPLNVTVNGQDAIAVMGADTLTLHSSKDGETLGKLGGFNPTGHEFFRSISSPVAESNVIVCPYARGDTMTGVDMDALANGKGEDAILWFRDDLGSDVPTPAAKDGRVYVVSDGKKARGKITCIDIKTGADLWSIQLPKSRIGFSSSPLVAGNHLYVTQENAKTYVIGPLDAESPTVVAENEVADSDQYTVASPVPFGNKLLIRSRHFLNCVGK